MLNHRVSIYVPSTVNANQVADAKLVDGYINLVKIRMAELFGGFTATNGMGGWYSKNVGLIQEPVVIVSAFTDDNGLSQHLGAVHQLAKEIAIGMTQEAVSLEVDSTLQFVSAAVAVAA